MLLHPRQRASLSRKANRPHGVRSHWIAREPNALTVLALLQRKLDDWLTTEKKLRDVLVIAPNNMAALDNLVALLQAAGYYQESWDLNERAISFDPLRPLVQYRRALKHWIMGRPLEADQVIARALELWPLHPLVWNARLLISCLYRSNPGGPHSGQRSVDHFTHDHTHRCCHVGCSTDCTGNPQSR